MSRQKSPVLNRDLQRHLGREMDRLTQPTLDEPIAGTMAELLAALARKDGGSRAPQD